MMHPSVVCMWGLFMNGVVEADKTNTKDNTRDGAPPDTWIDGIASIEGLSGGCFRFIFFRLRIGADGRPYREAVASIVCHSETITTCATQALVAVGKSVAQAAAIALSARKPRDKTRQKNH